MSGRSATTIRPLTREVSGLASSIFDRPTRPRPRSGRTIPAVSSPSLLPPNNRGIHIRPRRRRRRQVILVGLVVIVLAAVLTLVAVTNGSPNRQRYLSAHPVALRHRHTTTLPVSAVALSADGVTSQSIIAENKLPGTTSWQISGQPSSGSIQGFASLNYASVGQEVGVYVSTSAPQFRVVAYRIGYYHGAGAREVWASPEISGVIQPACPLTPGVNMVSCDNWTRSLTIRVTRAFTQGDYLLKLTGSDNTQNYIQLTVWDRNSTATYVVMSRTLTEEGWNTYGGYSFYQGEGPCTLGQTSSYPPCNRARIVSLDRPFAEGNGASDFLQSEYPLLFFMEHHGLDVAYVTDITVSDHPSLLLRHRALLSLDHDETWTYSELQGALAARSSGVNIAFFGAAAIVRHTRL